MIELKDKNNYIYISLKDYTTSLDAYIIDYASNFELVEAGEYKESYTALYTKEEVKEIARGRYPLIIQGLYTKYKFGVGMTLYTDILTLYCYGKVSEFSNEKICKDLWTIIEVSTYEKSVSINSRVKKLIQFLRDNKKPFLNQMIEVLSIEKRKKEIIDKLLIKNMLM